MFSLCYMLKRGVSPVVATVLLIVIVVILGAIIFIWARGFLSESAVKGDRVVESSCNDVKFEVQIVKVVSECSTGSAIDINNIGNIPIYGVKVLQFNEDEGSADTVFDGAFESGTITVGKSSSACLGSSVNSGDKFRVVPKLLAKNEDRTIAYTCPEKDGITETVV